VDQYFAKAQDTSFDRTTPLLTPPGDSDFATTTMRHKLNRKPSDLSKEHSPTVDVPDLVSDSGLTNEDMPVKQNLASPPPTPEVTAHLAQQAAIQQNQDDSEQYGSFTRMLEQSLPIVNTSGFNDQTNFQGSVENWISMSQHQYPQNYWVPGHQVHPSVDTQMSFDFSHLDIPQQSPLAYRMHDGRQQN